jgi:hypothetical protein
MHLGLVEVEDVEKARNLGAEASRGRYLTTEWELSQIIDGGHLTKTWFVTSEGVYRKGDNCSDLGIRPR